MASSTPVEALCEMAHARLRPRPACFPRADRAGSSHPSLFHLNFPLPAAPLYESRCQSVFQRRKPRLRGVTLTPHLASSFTPNCPGMAPPAAPSSSTLKGKVQKYLFWELGVLSAPGDTRGQG